MIWPALLAGAFLLDATVRPRGLRRPAGLWLTSCTATALFGLFLALSGNPVIALLLALALFALFAVASNAKNAMLGEPLLFSDLALIGAVFRHPQFYLSAIRPWQGLLAALVAAALAALLAMLFVTDPVPHALGLALMLGALAALWISVRPAARARRVPAPDATADVGRLGIFPALLLYWLRWREAGDPPACAASSTPLALPAGAPPLVVVIQCESFADPAELFGDPALALPALAQARAEACQHGRLEVSGFGAYTMRTEFGVLFGRDEAALGFRRYDPFLTALGEATWALPARLAPAGFASAFVHPHDMRFYGRDRIMPAGGFARLVGEEHFTPPGPDEGRYVTDAAMTEVIAGLARAATGPTLLYAVTIENHGPWAPHGTDGLVPGYLRLVRKGDAMLADLSATLAALARERAQPALLVFFGDHRPSIPGATDPAGPRHTPYVMLRFGADGRPQPGSGAAVDLTPAGLHHAILDQVLGTPRA